MYSTIYTLAMKCSSRFIFYSFRTCIWISPLVHRKVQRTYACVYCMHSGFVPRQMPHIWPWPSGQSAWAVKLTRQPCTRTVGWTCSMVQKHIILWWLLWFCNVLNSQEGFCWVGVLFFLFVAQWNPFEVQAPIKSCHTKLIYITPISPLCAASQQVTTVSPLHQYRLGAMIAQSV